MADHAIINKAKSWLQSNIDDQSKSEIEKMLSNVDDTALIDAFYKDLEFGTGGLRGIMGVGSNRVNVYTIGKATQGLANYLIKNFPGEAMSVAIAYDCRNNSKLFAETTASVFAANGIKVYLFEELRPTPALSFAIRYLNCHSGVVITASHNPKEYNGYKAYWNDGAQIIAPHDKNIIKEVDKITDLNAVKYDHNSELIVKIGAEVDEAYIKSTCALSLSPESIKAQKDLKIVYSSIHGSGITLVPQVLERFGFENVSIVQEQAVTDGNFPTVIYPNPEEAEALSMALAKAKEIDADILMGTDPDADRVGIAVKNEKGEFQLLNGNQTGALLLQYLISQWKAKGKLDGKQFTVKTIVTSDLLKEISESMGVKSYETLTGFKFIAALIHELEGKEKFIGGGEESYGYLIGDIVRDKDAVASCALLAEMTAWCKTNGTTPFGLLLNIYEEQGLFHEDLVSITKKGKSGADEIVAMMKSLRSNPPAILGGSKVVSMLDYQNSIQTDLKTGKTSVLDYPKSDVLQFVTQGGDKVSARPSGTEPKIKFYCSVKTDLKNKQDYRSVLQTQIDKISAIKNDLKL
jgi:phosphoglucomutase